MEDFYENTIEIDKYLAEPDVDRKNNSFDILNWWKVNSSKYPILGEIARNILAIQISTIASKYASSTGCRILDSFRSSLSPPMVEALICCQSWLRSSRLPLDLKPQLEDHESYASLESGNY